MRRHLRARWFGRLVAALVAASPALAHAQVQINALSDLAFDGLSMTGGDQTRSESVCATSGLVGGRYSVTATGSANGTFALVNGPALLPYEVQWASSGGQTSGTNLTSGTMLTGQTAPLLNCALGNSASLIVIIRGTQIAKATAGSYSGTLTILLTAN